jgi:hypothetical protein
MEAMLEGALHELDTTGTVSSHTRKLIVLGGRTRTVRPGQAAPAETPFSQEEIRRLTGA